MGTVTAGNAPGITDGAAATVVASERAVERLGLKPLARIVGYAQAEVAPKWLFLAPVEGVRRLLDRIELPIEAFDLVEINEAFAAQTLADGRELGFDWDKVNVNGGAIALGHPIGASGRADRRDAAPRAAPARGPLRPRDALPRRRRLGRDGLRAGLSARRGQRGPRRWLTPDPVDDRLTAAPPAVDRSRRGLERRHRWPVVALWFVLTIGLFVASLAAGGTRTAEAVGNDQPGPETSNPCVPSTSSGQSARRPTSRSTRRSSSSPTRPDGRRPAVRGRARRRRSRT